MEIEIANRLDQRVEFQIPAHPPARMKILADALAQIARLADVDDRAEAVLVQIHAGLVRDGSQFFADGFGGWHAQNLTQRREDRKGILTLAAKRKPAYSRANQRKETYARKSDPGSAAHRTAAARVANNPGSATVT